MHWLGLSLVSAILLGLYDIAKKQSLNQNAVWPVLFLCTLSGLPVLLVFLAWGARLDPVGPQDLFFLALKSAIVSASWAFTYRAIKHLPVSIASPIRASAPLFTLLIAVFFFSERPSRRQITGIILILISYWIFALAGRREGIRFSRDPWIWSMLAGTLLGALSGIYDKALLQNLGYSPMTVQVYFTAFMLLIQGLWVLQLRHPWKTHSRDPFQWRWSIIAVGFLLVLADQAYFQALHHPDALISIVSMIRRSSVMIAFLLGFIVFKERQRKIKSLALIGMISGLILLMR